MFANHRIAIAFQAGSITSIVLNWHWLTEITRFIPKHWRELDEHISKLGRRFSQFTLRMPDLDVVTEYNVVVFIGNAMPRTRSSGRLQFERRDGERFEEIIVPEDTYENGFASGVDRYRF